MSYKSKMVGVSRSPVLVSLARLAVLGASFATAPIIARDLGPSGRGLYAAFLGVLGLAPILLGLGLPLAIRLRASSGNANASMKTVILMTPFLAAFAACIGTGLALHYFDDTSSKEQLAFVGAVMTSSLFIYTLCAQSVLIGQRKFAAIAALQCIQGLTSAVVTVVVWLCAELTVGWLLLSYAIGTLLSAVVAGSLVRTKFDIRSAPLGPLLRQGTRFISSQLAETGGSTLPLILAIAAIGAHEAGYFSVAVTLSAIPIAVGYAIGSVVFSAVAGSPKTDRKKVAESSLKASLVWGSVVSIFITLSVPVVVPVLFGSEFKAAVPAAIITCAASGATVVNYVGTQILAAEGRAGMMSIWQCVGLVTSISGLFVLGHFWGAPGAAAGVAMGWIITTFCIVGSCHQSARLLLISGADLRSSYTLLTRGSISVHP